MSFMSGRLNVFSVSSATCRLTCSEDIFLPNVGPTFSTCLRHVSVCRDDMSFYGSWRRDVTPTFPTKKQSQSIILVRMKSHSLESVSNVLQTPDDRRGLAIDVSTRN